eukprot:SAG25_NODE_802_length_5262_cov_30.348441_1_plen_182_part_00
MRSPRGIMSTQPHSAAPPPRTSVPGREAVPRAWWSGRHGTRYLPQETSRIVHRLRLQRVTAAVAAAAGSRAEATAQGAGVLVRCGVARGCCTYVASRAGVREGSGRHRSERLPADIRGAPLHALCTLLHCRSARSWRSSRTDQHDSGGITAVPFLQLSFQPAPHACGPSWHELRLHVYLTV